MWRPYKSMRSMNMNLTERRSRFRSSRSNSKTPKTIARLTCTDQIGLVGILDILGTFEDESGGVL